MRNVVGATRRTLFLTLALLGGLVAGPLAARAEPRIITTPNSDYAGFDLKTLKGVKLDACKAACLSDTACRAFTFQQKAGTCYLKNDFGVLSAAPGMTAGRVVEAVDFTPSLERKRIGELDFLSTSFVDEARALAGSIKKKFDPADSSYQALRDAGGIAYRGGNYEDAVDDFGKALAIADDNPGLWLDFAYANLGLKPDNWSDKQTAAQNVTAAAIAAYIRADETANLAAALALMGDGFQIREIWKPAYRAYRKSIALLPNDEVKARYEKAIAEHGFRITGTDVDSDSANPRICVNFSDPLPVSRSDLADFVTVSGGDGLSVEPETSQICIDGAKHGGRYQLRVRAGLPSSDGESLLKPADITVYVKDRSPFVGFAGNAYVVPAGQGASIPITSVNTDKIKATIYRIGDRGLAGKLRDSQFLKQLEQYSADDIADAKGEQVWTGSIEVTPKLNENIVTAIPVAEVVPDLKAGVYVITAKAAEAQRDSWSTLATQWFVVSDLGLTTLSGSDGIHAIVRSLSDAKAVAGVKLRLVATNDQILGEAVTDAEGHARFEPGLARGTGGMAPQIIDASTDGGDYTFLDLTRAAFDLSDRGVDGRPAPSALDVFLTPERGIYRPGETLHLTGLVRDTRANAATGLAMTLVIERPDGVEALRRTLSDGGAGGYTADYAFPAAAMRGAWHAKLYADPKGAALADVSVLVEDFEPERLAFDLTTKATTLAAGAPASIDLEAKYLYGATAPDLSVEGDIDVRPVSTLAALPNFTFGLADDAAGPSRNPLDIGATTDEEGKASFDVSLPELPVSTRPFQAKLIIRLADTNGRSVERTLSLPVKPAGTLIGIHPLFDAANGVDEGSNARFEVIAVAPDGSRTAASGLTWKLERLETTYQWYKSSSGWDYELITNARRVAAGTVDAKADGPVTIEGKVEWGKYRLTVAQENGTPAATSVEFNAGWYVGTATSETPDVLRVALDKPAYKIGETAKLRLDPRFAGVALVSVVDDRLISMKAVDVPAEGTTVDLPVTDAWGPGAYVTATLYRPMDVAAKRMPARALGLTWAKVAPGDRQLDVSLGVVDEMRPRGPMTIPVSIKNLKAGSDAYVTVAAVDVGILNLTNFKAPDPDGWYFGQRKLGMEIRDLYGLLIDRMAGVPGIIRSGGDGGAVRLMAPPPTQKLVAFYSGIVKVGADGKATVSFEIPEFNGSVRVMAIAWTKDAVGHASQDVIVRDPVVVTSSIPRFLLDGDASRLLVEVNNVAGEAGEYRLNVTPGDGILIADADQNRTITLAAKQRISFNIPITAKAIGDFTVRVDLVTPKAEDFPQELAIGVRPAGSPVTRRNIVALNGGGTLTVGPDAIAEFVPGTQSVGVSIGGASRLDVAGILQALDRYPYGCVEQLTSRAMPLVYLDDVAVSIGLGTDKAVRERVQKAIAGVLADQDSTGSFGLWGPYDTGDLWLDSYVTDFLTRASEKGYDVPKVARDLALDNLANRINYAEDFEKGGEDIAYALYVLARSGRAAIGDLRYYAETKLQNFRTALAKAQIGAALSLYGDKQRSAMAFKAALQSLDGSDDYKIWRGDYGTMLRDRAAVLTLAAESSDPSVDVRALITKVAAEADGRTYTSTQENAWMMLAAAALIKDAAKTQFEIDGSAVAGPLFKRFLGEKIEASPVAIRNLGGDTLDAVVAATGVPKVPDPAGGNGFTIERHYYTPEGEEIADIASVPQNTRIVVEVTVTADGDREGQVLIVDPVAAGYEIENPNVSASGETEAFDWLEGIERDAAHTEARTDRFVAALNRKQGDPLEYSVAYSMRAVSPGTFTLPAATVEDMYRPGLAARTDQTKVEVIGPTR